MPLGDYKNCDVCNERTFSDSQINYKLDMRDLEMKPTKVGEWKVLCKKCARDYEIIIIKRED